MDIKKLAEKIYIQFQKSFGNTSLRERNEDIFKESLELSRFTTIDSLKEESGDLLCTLLVGIIENGWNPEELIEKTLLKIKRREKQYRAYGRKLNTVILGGAFDPITPGHIQIAEFLLNFSKEFDSVWIMPCFKHMFGKKMESPEHRLEMCRLAIKHDRRISVSGYEIQKKLGGETYYMVKNLLNEDVAKNERNFSIAMGMDNANTFDKWANYQDLERMIRCVIIPRTGVAMVKNGWYLKPPHMFLIPEKPLLEISSTDVRKVLNQYWTEGIECVNSEKGILDSKDFIHPEVLKYIEDNGLYKKS
jgi:nicotinate-nucleotide adenylyltransferase